MQLEPGGINIYYIDESGDTEIYAMSSIEIPFLRKINDEWHIVWDEHFKKIKQWRRDLSIIHKIPMRKELHAAKFASGRGHYKRGKQQFSKKVTAAIYRDSLCKLGFLPSSSIISVAGKKATHLYGEDGLTAVFYALLQRINKSCKASKCNGLVFFDEGHGEYRKLFRKSLLFLPTGSQYGSWGDSVTQNQPLDKFVKDGNLKDSKYSYYIQLADLIAYTVFLKMKEEDNRLSEWQKTWDLGKLYDAIPALNRNMKASLSNNDGIVRLHK